VNGPGLSADARLASMPAGPVAFGHPLMDNVVSARELVVLLGGFPALAGADLDVGPGEVVLLQGPNGAGKSTLLRALAGLVRADSGRLEVLGMDLVADHRVARRYVGYLGHANQLYAELTVSENVRFALRAARADLRRAPEALERLGLTGALADQPAGSLSAGQRRRTALAALVARDPQLWLLDEPHAGLDAEGREVLDRLVGELAAEGRSVVLASHEAERARPLAERVVEVAGGVTEGGRRPERAVGAEGAPMAGAEAHHVA
jgi:heme ABC exporter ATP-binding subunit CcmA